MTDRKNITEKMSANQQARLVDQMTARMKEMLSGFPPEIQGAMLADLTAIWLVGHPPQIRHHLYCEHAIMIWPLVEANEKIIFGDAGHPAGREMP
jgi:hypothetical protein